MPKSARKHVNNSRHEPVSKDKNAKASHLYTDDNPVTTIHGTGFKDIETAKKTLELISNRSLTYQFQTVNTMYHRAKHHPSNKQSATSADSSVKSGIQEAMEYYRNWLDHTYPEAKAALRLDGFKPMLSKKYVEQYTSQIKQVDPEAYAFASVYVGLGAKKRLANTLVDQSKPTEADWERKRYDQLCLLVPQTKQRPEDWTMDELYETDRPGKIPSELHIKLIGWGWSPIGSKKWS